MTTNRMTPTMPIVVYWRLRYAWAPAWIAAAISCMRALPAGLARIHCDRPNAIGDGRDRADEREDERGGHASFSL